MAILGRLICSWSHACMYIPLQSKCWSEVGFASLSWERPKVLLPAGMPWYTDVPRCGKLWKLGSKGAKVFTTEPMQLFSYYIPLFFSVSPTRASGAEVVWLLDVRVLGPLLAALWLVVLKYSGRLGLLVFCGHSIFVSSLLLWWPD